MPATTKPTHFGSPVPISAQYPKIYKGFNFSAFRTPKNDTMELFYAVKFIKAFIIPWKNQAAYALKLIDANGNELKTKKDLKKQIEKDEFSSINRAAWEIKRQVQYYPGLNNNLVIKLWRLLTSRFIVKEEMAELFNNQIVLWEEKENTPFLEKGFYKITTDLFADMANAGDIIVISSKIPSIGLIQGKNTFAIRLDDEDRVIILSDGEYEALSKAEYEEIKNETEDRMRIIKAVNKALKTGIPSPIKEETETTNIESPDILFFGDSNKRKKFFRRNNRKSFIEAWLEKDS